MMPTGEASRAPDRPGTNGGTGASLSTSGVITQTRMLEALRSATLGEYEILAELGRGGMATVFLAHDISLDRKVAIKVMSPALLDGEGAIERFKREARTAGALSHPHIIPIHAVRQSGDLLFFVMKFVEGRPLDSVIQTQGKLPIPMVVQILAEVAGALAYAHRKGVVHRDVKPANIMLDDDGWAVVTDFGIAKVAQQQGLTLTGSTVGTPAYMSPEQCLATDVTGRSDQYSLGIVAYEMLTGRVPFSAGSMMGMFLAHMNEPAAPIADVRPDCPAELIRIIDRMMGKTPEERWPNLEDVVVALTALQKPESQSQTRHSMVALARVSDGRPRADDFVRPESPTPMNRPSQAQAVKTDMSLQVGRTRVPRWAWAAVGVPVAVAAAWMIVTTGTSGVPAGTVAAGSGPTDSARAVPSPTSTDAIQQSAVTPAVPAVSSAVSPRGDSMKASPVTAPPGRTVAVESKTADRADTTRTPATTNAVAAAPPRVDSTPTPPPAPTASPFAGAPAFSAISAGGSTTCGALADDGGVLCWGAPSPTGEIIQGLLFEKIAVGDGHICGLTPSGEAYCWGTNSAGQLGDGSNSERPGPTPVKASQRFAEISVGASHTCALTTDGAAFCWGANRFGQLGDGSRSNRNRPVAVRSTAGNQGFQSLTTGGSHTCGVTRANKAYCWGDGFSGQVGNAMQDFAQEPFAVKTDLAFRSVVAGDRHTCGLTTSGRVYCWGSNKDGQLGNETRDDRSVPDSVATEQIFVSVGAGGSHNCGISSRRQLWCWGQNVDGRLGDGTRSIRTVPVTAAGGQSFSRVSAGSGHTCGLTTSGHAMCWGGNARGQLGAGSSSQYSASPVIVKVKGG